LSTDGRFDESSERRGCDANLSIGYSGHWNDSHTDRTAVSRSGVQWRAVAII